MIIDKKQIESNREEMLERKQLYKQYGYDQDASRDFILERCLPLTKPVLEIGTGKGHMTVLLAKNTGKVLTIDNSVAEQEFARLNAAAEGVLEKIGFVVRDAAQLPYPDQSFGTVVSVNAFHHFENPFAVLAEMIRVCSGKLVIADFNREGFEVVRQIHRDEGREHEERCGDFSIVGEYLKEHNFTVNRQEGHCQLVYAAERKT
ncbi:MAG: methyltransferase domain-containing protein [bacterium]